jgi:Xaa-Pro aminopeptidase
MNKRIGGSDRKIDPVRRKALKADGTVVDNYRVETGPTDLAFTEWAAAGLTVPDLPALRAYRLSRLQAEIQRHDCAGLLLFDPINIRYATDSSNMQLWTAHNPARAAFVPPAGKAVLWDFMNCTHLTDHLPLIGEVRHGASFFYFETGDQTAAAARAFAGQIYDLVRHYGGKNRRLAVDRMEHAGFVALADLGVACTDGQPLTELARAVKNTNEIAAIRCAIHACESAMAEMRQQMEPGLSESAVWAALHAGNIRRGGEWIEARLMASGPRTNPWFQECGPRRIKAGDLLAFDTDMVGTYGYCCDISRTWLVGDGTPTATKKRLYQVAYDHIMTNIDRLEPGMRFGDMSRVAHRLPAAYRARRYPVLAHGVGLCDEYPAIRYPEDVDTHGYGGAFEVGMTLSVEAYIGAVDGKEGVKLEEQVVITDSGAVPLSCYPYEAAFLS